MLQRMSVLFYREEDYILLSAIRYTGRECDQGAWLYEFRRNGKDPSYEELCESYSHLVQGGLIHELRRGGIRITSRGRIYLRGEDRRRRGQEAGERAQQIAREGIAENAHAVGRLSLGDYHIARMRVAAAEKQLLAGVPTPRFEMSVLRCCAVLLLTLFAYGALAGTIVFACLFTGDVLWRIVLPVIGVVAFIAAGTVAYSLSDAHCGYWFRRLIQITCLPAMGLFLLFAAIFSYL